MTGISGPGRCLAGVLLAAGALCAACAWGAEEPGGQGSAPDVDPSLLAPARTPLETGEAAPALPATLDLETAQREALARNPSLLQVGEQVAQARARVKQARSLYYPQLEAGYSGTYAWLSDADVEAAQESLDSNDDLLEGLDEFIAEGNADLPRRTLRDLRRAIRQNRADLGEARSELEETVESYTVELTAGYLLFDGFSRKYTAAMAKFGRREIEQAEREARRLLLSAVAQSFYGVQLARENIEVARADIGFNRRLLKDAKALRARGKGSTSDVLNFEVRLRAAQTSLLVAVRDHEAARFALALLMGLPGGLLPDTTRVKRLASETPEEMKTPAAEQALQYALDHRPDLLQRSYGVRRAEAGVRQRYGAFYPRISLFASYGGSRNGDSTFREEDLSTAVGFNVSYEIFSGGRRRAELTEARHAQREAEIHRRDLELEVLSEVRNALLDLSIAQQQLILQRATAGHVEKNRGLVVKEYNAGKATLARLNQAQRDLVEAQVRLTLARITLRQNRYELRTATAETLADFHNGTRQPGKPEKRTRP